MNNLKRKLHKMHSFHFIHLDIKPQNILYSNFRKDFVFIDFGYSEMVKEKLGFKTLTNFAGTLGYCAPEMV